MTVPLGDELVMTVPWVVSDRAVGGPCVVSGPCVVGDRGYGW